MGSATVASANSSFLFTPSLSFYNDLVSYTRVCQWGTWPGPSSNIASWSGALCGRVVASPGDFGDLGSLLFLTLPEPFASAVPFLKVHNLLGFRFSKYYVCETHCVYLVFAALFLTSCLSTLFSTSLDPSMTTARSRAQRRGQCAENP